MNISISELLQDVSLKMKQNHWVWFTNWFNGLPWVANKVHQEH